MYTEEKLNELIHELNIKRNTLNDMHDDIFSNFFVFENKQISYDKIKNLSTMLYSFNFKHKNLKKSSVKLCINTQEYLKDKNMDISISFLDKNSVKYYNINQLKLSINQYSYISEILFEVTSLLNNIKYSELEKKINEYNDFKKIKSAAFIEHIGYKIELKIQNYREKYKRYFKALTKERTREEFEKFKNNKESFSYITLIYNDENKNLGHEFSFEYHYVEFEGNNILLNDKIIKEKLLYRYFLKNCVYLHNRFITKLDELEYFLGEKLNSDDIVISMKEEDFKTMFNKAVIKNIMGQF